MKLRNLLKKITFFIKSQNLTKKIPKYKKEEVT